MPLVVFKSEFLPSGDAFKEKLFLVYHSLHKNRSIIKDTHKTKVKNHAEAFS